jgi:hypothetical protein
MKLCFPIIIILLSIITPLIAAEQKEQDHLPYYFFEWNESQELSANFGLSKGNLLIQYTEKFISDKYPRFINAISLSAGLTDASNDISGNDSAGHIQSGTLKTMVLPVTAALHKTVKSGFWNGQFGIGLTGYYYCGSINMSHIGKYSGAGFGLNLALPGEFRFRTDKKEKVFFKLNYDLQLPITLSKYAIEDKYFQTNNHEGLFLGLAVGRYW